MFFSSMVQDEDKQLMNSIFNFSFEQSFGSYLGAPVLFLGSKASHVGFLIDHVQKKLRG